MNTFTTFIAVWCLATTATARPGIGHSGLQGVPDIQHFGDVHYPKYDLIHLGEYSKGFLPGDSVHETKHVTVKEPQPYPVQVPVPHPYPVPVHKPYPVVHTKYVKVPHAVPYEIVKQVPVPIEVPKPYPVPIHGDSHGAGSAPLQDLHGAGGNYGSNQELSNYETEESNSDDASSGDLEGHQENNNEWTPLDQH